MSMFERFKQLGRKPAQKKGEEKKASATKKKTTSKKKASPKKKVEQVTAETISFSVKTIKD